MRHAFLITAFACILQARGRSYGLKPGWNESVRQTLRAKTKLRSYLRPVESTSHSRSVVQAARRRSAQCNIPIGDLSGPAGHLISRANLTVYREHYVRVEHGSPVPKNMRRPPLGPGLYADALIPEAPRAG